MKPLPSREDQIKIMEGAKDRTAAAVLRILANPEVRAILKRQAEEMRAERDNPRPMVGLFASLTPEQQARALAYRGPDNLGEKDNGF